MIRTAVRPAALLAALLAYPVALFAQVGPTVVPGGAPLQPVPADAPTATAVEPPRNVLIVFVDDLGWADLGCYGNAFHETPHIDQLATDGLKFTAAYASCPVCSPSRAALMTGRDPARTGLTNFIPGHFRPFAPLLEPPIPDRLPLDEVTFATVLGDAATTASFGKWHLGDTNDTEGPGGRGFDEWLVTVRNVSPSLTTPDGVEKREGEYTTDVLTERTEAFLREHADDDKPWVCLLSHYAVHIPVHARPDLIAKYEAKPKAEGHPSDPAFAAMLEMVDESVGRLRTVLQETGQAENTVILFTSDNGGLHSVYHGDPSSIHGQSGDQVSSNAPLRGEKGSLYEGGIRVPLLVHWPGVTEGGRACDAAVTTSDLTPTILHLAGSEPPAGVTMDGVSLVPVFRGECDAARDAVFWHYPHYHHSRPAGAVRIGHHKLIEFYTADGTGEPELYDLREDLGETKNLAAALPERTSELRSRLAAYRADAGALMPRPNPAYDAERADEWWRRPAPGFRGKTKPVLDSTTGPAPSGPVDTADVDAAVPLPEGRARRDAPTR
ncbi:sulfatase [Alienimonas californiensis]|uniref:Arylsulfatase n=1 Tax=Alienimonas californiensis TaxID=2527989 RepID=A0A517PCC8_9PLAN|nr:sulfatase [Alienimonas californiensis]QDT17001.1 Arylsulfatase [Alienimonas californiensis]